ncbi:MAG: bifunctional DNA-formamidopyrimidine glycosylase/DNA-(apurinic or apyrimidinic site) lyase [Syntrophales bacterium LBB04]|nr:bifunctional DNA-formamidopyrimidine glycosylase/DNA-(apurinic or apyrimidinic site) lyase [Syntrophales bacterium LBB04]
MPELPEVETLCRQLKDRISGARILAVKILDAKLGPLENLKGRTMLFPYRQGKGINIMLDNGWALLLHLRMTGRLLWQEGKPKQFPHTRFMISVSGGRLDLIDPRRFATLRVQKDAVPAAAGHDPREDLAPKALFEKGKGRSLPIKSFLMDQRFISGIGNIYACEILYKTGIDPRRKTKGVSLADWKRIVRVAASVLKKAVACRGTTVSDWRDLHGQSGEYQHHIKVYGKEGRPCPQCGGAIERFKLGGRGTYFCPVCQK